MPAAILVSGNISLSDVEEALKKHFEGTDRMIEMGLGVENHDSNSEKSDSSKTKDDSSKNAAVFIHETAYAEVSNKLEKKEKELYELEKTSSKALNSVSTFHQQQKQLFDEFVLLRQRYDDQRGLLMDTLYVNHVGVMLYVRVTFLCCVVSIFH